MNTIADRLALVRDHVTQAASAAGRLAAEIDVVAVSKTYGAEAVEDAVRAGQLRFGENRVQEAQGKFHNRQQHWPGVRLHLIGALQTNKARDAVRLCDVIESLDRPRLADAIAEAIQREGRAPELLVQVNVGDEPQKAGIPTGQADSFIEACQARFGDALRGLMCVPPAASDPAGYFRGLAERATRHGLSVLSMGMSADFATAILCGSTRVRVGSAIFGARAPGRADAA